eukprot:Pgem_evm1s12805
MVRLTRSTQLSTPVPTNGDLIPKLTHKKLKQQQQQKQREHRRTIMKKSPSYSRLAAKLKVKFNKTNQINDEDKNISIFQLDNDDLGVRKTISWGHVKIKEYTIPKKNTLLKFSCPTQTRRH